MMFGGAALGSVALGSVLKDPGTIVDPTSLRPILTDVNGVDFRAYVQIDTFSKQDTLGQPVTATLTFLNTPTEPRTGDAVRVRFHESVEFAGTISRVRKRTPDLTQVFYDCELVDYSQILTRRQVRRNFTNMTVHAIVDSILDNELAGELITIGNIQRMTMVPLVDASAGSRVFDLLRDLAGATGQTFWVDFDKRIQMRGTPATWDRGTSVLSSPGQDFVLDESGEPILSESGGFILEEVQDEPLQTLNQATVLLDGTTLVQDRETYRNVQTVVVTGTPQVENEDPLTVSVQRTNEDEIADRQVIEGGTGRYEEWDEITHPTSNRLDDLLLLGNGYGDLKLATSGTLRVLLTVQVRGYGYRAGQVGTVNLPTFGVVGEFLLQRVTLKEVAAQHLFYTLELAESNAKRRAYESWLTILGKGKIAIQLFGTIAHDSVSFTTPGDHSWIVPADVTVVTITVKGASAGGGGGLSHWFIPRVGQPCVFAQAFSGGKGGNGGKAISTVNVVEGEELNLFIGTKGGGGQGGFGGCHAAPFPADGTNATQTTVFRAGISLAEAYAGGGGHKAAAIGTGSPGTNGGGSGAIVTIGGGKTGGAGGAGTSEAGFPGADGSHGNIEIEW